MDYTLHATGIDIDSDLSLDALGNLIEGLRQSKDATTWCIADALVYGSDHFQDDLYQILDDTNWSEHTIANYMTTARKIPRAGRRAAVSFSNHSELTSLSEADRDYALDQLESKVWSREDLRAWKRELKGDSAPEEMTITLQWRGHKVVDGILTAAFVAPDETYEIVGFKAIVRRVQVVAQEMAS
jgi:hypothetical protein